VSRWEGKAGPELAEARQAGWLGNLDSNQDKQSQSLLCYRYTIPQRISEQIQWFRNMFGG
jgi:hypothetical protein